MGTELTKRQLEILGLIIKEFIDTADPVGSVNLVRKYELPYSPATIRNEMQALARAGFLKKPHSSGGRMPTSMALRFYINQMMKEQPLPVLQEVALKQRLYDKRYALEHMLHQAVAALSEITGYMAWACTDDGCIFKSGAVNILNHPEFYDINATRETLQLIDDFDRMFSLFEKAEGEKDWHVLLGEDMDLASLENLGVLFTRFQSGNKGGVVALLGPARMKYGKVIPAVRYLRGLLEEMGTNWR